MNNKHNILGFNTLHLDKNLGRLLLLSHKRQLIVLPQNRSTTPHMRTVRIIEQPHLNAIEKTGWEVVKVVDDLILFNASGVVAARRVVDRGPLELGLLVGQEAGDNAHALFGHGECQVELFGEFEHPFVDALVVGRPDLSQVVVFEAAFFDACLFH